MFTVTIWIPDKLVRFSNGQLALPMYCGLKTGPVFKWLKTRWRILTFENRTQIVSGKWPFEYQTVRFSDGYCSGFVITIKTLFFSGKIYSTCWNVKKTAFWADILEYKKSAVLTQLYFQKYGNKKITVPSLGGLGG